MASRKPKPKPRSGPGSRTGAAARSGPPSPEANRKDKVLSIRIPDEAREALDQLAARWSISRSAVVARLAIEATGKR